MTDISIIVVATTHAIGGWLGRLTDHASADSSPADAPRDRGAVSLEQVLWFVAAGVSVAVIAAIVWSQIRDQADAPINTPSAP